MIDVCDDVGDEAVEGLFKVQNFSIFGFIVEDHYVEGLKDYLKILFRKISIFKNGLSGTQIAEIDHVILEESGLFFVFCD